MAGRRGAAKAVIKELGEHPDGGAIQVLRRALWAVCELEQGQRHVTQRRRTGGCHPGTGARLAGGEAGYAQARAQRRHEDKNHENKNSENKDSKDKGRNRQHRCCRQTGGKDRDQNHKD
jgi:hypothetical protein